MRKEYLLLLAVIFFIFSFVFKSSKESEFIEIKKSIIKKQQKITNIEELKGSWKNKRVNNKLNSIKKYIPSESLASWSKKKNKLKASFVSLNPKIYNRVIKDIWNMKIEIVKFKSKVVDEKYEVKLECKWQ